MQSGNKTTKIIINFNVSRTNKNYLCVAWLDVAEKEHHNYEEKSTEEIKSTPPSTGHFDTLGQNISEWLSVLEKV